MNQKFLLKIAEKLGTPLYVYSEEQIRKNYREFLSAFKSRYRNTKIFYALKANSSLAICHILRQEGSCADVVSIGELKVAQRIGIKPKDIIFTNNSKTDQDLDDAIEAGIIVNIDSIDELHRLHKIAKNKRKAVNVSFRVNPAIDPKTHPKISTGLKESKFGIHLENNIALDAYITAQTLDWIEIKGIHTHIGSQITDMNAFKDMTEKIMQFTLELKEKIGLELKFIDLGGGLGIQYTDDATPTPDDYAGTIIPVVNEYNKKLNYEPELWFEPGRYILGNVGVLLCKVTGVKETPYKKFVNVDAGFNVLMRPSMYDSYHRIQVLNRIDENATETYDIVGNICESGDILARERKLPRVKGGDIIAVYDTGAYGFSMSSQYNQRPRPAEILTWGGTVEVIREKETFDDLLRNQKAPNDLID